MGSRALLLLTALSSGADDAWQIPVLEATLDSRIHALEGFPAPLYPPDLEGEVEAALEGLARLDRNSAVVRARALFESVPDSSELSWTARRVLAASGDLETLRLGVRSYFDAPARWREVLAASDDPRLRDFNGGGRRDTFSERFFLTTLERNLARARERESIRALLAWARTAPDPSSPRRVLGALPEGIPLETSVRSWLRQSSKLTEAEPALITESESFLAIKDRVLALSKDVRYRAIRELAERDHEALLGIPMPREDVDRLYPYFARSRHRAIRHRVRRAEKARGPALASLLLSSLADDGEKREALAAMPDAWPGAVASGGAEIFEIAATLVPQEDLYRFLFEAEVDQSVLDALAIVPDPAARLRLESLGTAEAVERLARRSDRVLSVPTLSRLRREGERAAALALVSLGGAGASAWLRAEIATSNDLAPLLGAALCAPAEAEIAIDLARRVASVETSSPEGFAALARLPLGALVSKASRALAERMHLAMSLRGEKHYLPLLVELAVGPGGTNASREAAFDALAEADLGAFAPRLHRLAGDPDREVRLRAAAALVPSGEAWTMRLLLGNVDPSSAREQAIARGSVRRLPRDRAREILGEMVADGTAGSLGGLLYLELADETEARTSRRLRAQLWSIVAEDARAGDRTALLAASRLSHAEAIAAVTRRLSAP